MKRTIATICIIGSLIPAARAAEPAVAADASSGPSQIEFKFKFEPGRVIRQKVENITVGSLKIPGPLSEQKFSQSYEQVMTTTCRKVNADKSAVFDVSLGGIKMKMSMGPMALSYDSSTFDPQQADPMSGMVGRLFHAMEGVRFSVTVSDTGRPLKVEGLSESVRKAMARLAEGGDDQAARKMLEGMSKLMSDDQMNEQMQMYYRVTPPKEGPIKIGDKWDQTWSMKMPILGGQFDGRGEYELIGIEEVHGRPCAKIRVKESFIMRPGEAGKPAEGADAFQALFQKMKMELSTSGGEGIAHIDFARGELVRLRQTQKMTLKISPREDAGDAAAEIPTMTQTFNSSTRIEMMDEPAAAPAGVEHSARQ